MRIDKAGAGLAVILATVLIFPGVLNAFTDGKDFSDLVRVSENTFLVVNDRKHPIEPGFRIALLHVLEKTGVEFQPITVPDWQDPDQAPSDLEACCSIPSRPNEFLLGESSLYKGKYGRIFHVELISSDEGTPQMVVKGVMRIYDRQLDQRQCSFDGDNVAGMGCFQLVDGRLILAYGERGGESADGFKLGTLIWGGLDLDDYTFKKLGEAKLVNESITGFRDCSALHLIPHGDQSVSVISVATNDPHDNGPFHSVVYCAGKFEVDRLRGNVTFQRESHPLILAEMEGVKIEGLSLPAAHAPNSDFSISTDDENLGGIWRSMGSPNWPGKRQIIQQTSQRLP